MNEGTGAGAIERVHEGMPVVDAAGENVGTVAYVKMGDPQAVTTQGNEPSEPGLLGAIPAPVAREREPDVPEPLRSQLLRSGFIKVDGPGLADAARYMGSDRISEVSGSTVRLTPPISGTVGPQGAKVKTEGNLEARSGVADGEPLAAGTPMPSAREWSEGPSRGVLLGVGGGALAAISGVAGSAWLYRRRQREQNRPINRLRRQARRAAAQPAWPAGGLGAGLALAVLLGRRLLAKVDSEDAPARATDRPREVQRAGQWRPRVSASGVC